jgi:hypothetical protein
LAGQDWEPLVMLDDAKVDREMYFQILFKFYATMRFDLYHKVKDFWKQNEETIMKEFETRKKIKN